MNSDTGSRTHLPAGSNASWERAYELALETAQVSDPPRREPGSSPGLTKPQRAATVAFFYTCTVRLRSAIPCNAESVSLGR